MVPLHFVEGTRSLFFPNKRFLGFVSGFGACRMLFDASLIYSAYFPNQNVSWAHHSTFKCFRLCNEGKMF